MTEASDIADTLALLEPVMADLNVVDAVFTVCLFKPTRLGCSSSAVLLTFSVSMAGLTDCWTVLPSQPLTMIAANGTTGSQGDLCMSRFGVLVQRRDHRRYLGFCANPALRQNR